MLFLLNECLNIREDEWSTLSWNDIFFLNFRTKEHMNSFSLTARSRLGYSGPEPKWRNITWVKSFEQRAVVSLPTLLYCLYLCIHAYEHARATNVSTGTKEFFKRNFFQSLVLFCISIHWNFILVSYWSTFTSYFSMSGSLDIICAEYRELYDRAVQKKTYWTLVT